MSTPPELTAQEIDAAFRLYHARGGQPDAIAIRALHMARELVKLRGRAKAYPLAPRIEEVREVWEALEHLGDLRPYGSKYEIVRRIVRSGQMAMVADCVSSADRAALLTICHNLPALLTAWEALRDELNTEHPYREMWEAAEEELGRLRSQVGGSLGMLAAAEAALIEETRCEECRGSGSCTTESGVEPCTGCDGTGEYHRHPDTPKVFDGLAWLKGECATLARSTRSDGSERDRLDPDQRKTAEKVRRVLGDVDTFDGITAVEAALAQCLAIIDQLAPRPETSTPPEERREEPTT